MKKLKCIKIYKDGEVEYRNYFYQGQLFVSSIFLNSLDDYLLENIKANTSPRRPAKQNRADEKQQHMDGDEEEQTRQLKELDTIYQRQEKNYERCRAATGKIFKQQNGITVPPIPMQE